MAKEIKKTMVAPIAYLAGILTESQLQEFTEKFGLRAAGSSSSNGPREITILKDAEGNMLGRKCMVTNAFFVADRFSKNTTCIKEADAARGSRHAEARKALKEAEAILVEAREIADIEEKVAKFEEYDNAVQAANDLRSAEIVVKDEWLEGSFETIEDLAADLGVEVQTEEK